ncbi:MAG TPA: type IV pilus biogenesis/stability protein PilW [Burkholderiales bacterium]|nr:type IV pilus biogenesis/stability protein PilW [Burkholderiales bacterium]
MKRGVLVIALGALLSAGCQTVPEAQQDQIQAAREILEAGDMIVALPADAQTRAKAHTDLAAAYYELGNLAVALEETRIALRANPNYARAHNVRGLVHMDLRENAEAEQSFKRGLQLAPQDADLNHNYGWFLCQTNRADESVEWFLKAIKNPLYRTPARSYAAAGHCTERSDPKEAAEFYERALRLEPNNPSVLLSFAGLQYRQGQLHEARALVSRYYKLVKDPTAESLWLAHRIEHKLGDRMAANQYATELRRRYANSPQYQALQRGQYE